MAGRLDGKVGVITGGASGIGAALAERQRAAGIDTVVWDVRPGPGVDLVCDIADPDAVDDAVRVTVERVGPPARVTVTAGIGHGPVGLQCKPFSG